MIKYLELLIEYRQHYNTIHSATVYDFKIILMWPQMKMSFTPLKMGPVATVSIKIAIRVKLKLCRQISSFIYLQPVNSSI